MKMSKTVAVAMSGVALVAAFSGAAMASMNAADVCINNAVQAGPRMDGNTFIKIDGKDGIRATCEGKTGVKAAAYTGQYAQKFTK